MRPDRIEDVWNDPAMVLSQTCSLPFVTRLHPRLQMVGAFDFGLDGVPPGHYASHLVTRLDDARPLPDAAARVAVNGADSQSGWGALHGTGLPVGAATITGAHAASMAMVAAGDADLAAIDAVSWRLSPHPRLRVRATTAPTPAPPLITARPDLVAPLRAALTGAVVDHARRDAPPDRLAGLRADGGPAPIWA